MDERNEINEAEINRFAEAMIACATRDDVMPITKAGEIWTLEIDHAGSHWKVQTNTTGRDLDGLPMGTTRFEFNGWPAGELVALGMGGGFMAAGTLPNMTTLCEALEAHAARA